MQKRLAYVFAVLAVLSAVAFAQQPAPRDVTARGTSALAPLLEQAGIDLEPLKAVIVARRGEIILERGYHGHSVTTATNIKSASKSLISALDGIAIDKGVLQSVNQKIAPLLKGDLPSNPDPRLNDITIGHLLSMQAGLGRTSGANYGRWVASRNWVRAALAQPFVDEPGGSMLYSTGSSHLLSAILTRTAGRSTLELARDWLGPLEGFSIASWQRDPQGIYFGGNQMSMSARSLAAFGELYRNRGRSQNGTQLVSPEWIERSWQRRTNSRFTGDAYGYGWFQRKIGGNDTHYAWGYGGQMLYVAPSLDLTVVMTSNADKPAGRTGYRDNLHDLMRKIIEVIDTSGGSSK
jgi:CubicO group peptidase (beta-lactamase class C family)